MAYISNYNSQQHLKPVVFVLLQILTSAIRHMKSPSQKAPYNFLKKYHDGEFNKISLVGTFLVKTLPVTMCLPDAFQDINQTLQDSAPAFVHTPLTVLNDEPNGMWSRNESKRFLQNSVHHTRSKNILKLNAEDIK